MMSNGVDCTTGLNGGGITVDILVYRPKELVETGEISRARVEVDYSNAFGRSILAVFSNNCRDVVCLL